VIPCSLSTGGQSAAIFRALGPIDLKSIRRDSLLRWMFLIPVLFAVFSKAAGVLTWPAMIGWFIEPPWQWFFGLCPTFWSAKLFWDLDAGHAGAWFSASTALLYTSAVGVWLFRRFDRQLHR
jgi:hypothetical protein